jgi:hypothetical protein
MTAWPPPVPPDRPPTVTDVNRHGVASLPSLLMVVALAVGCGGSSSSAKNAAGARAAYLSFVKAEVNGDSKAACALIAKNLIEEEYNGEKNCEVSFNHVLPKITRRDAARRIAAARAAKVGLSNGGGIALVVLHGRRLAQLNWSDGQWLIER